jgi:hypothetical protein
MMKFPCCVFHPALLWCCVIVMMKFFFHALCFLVPSPLPVPLFALSLPSRLVAVADALLGMVYIDLVFLLLATIVFPRVTSPYKVETGGTNQYNLLKSIKNGVLHVVPSIQRSKEEGTKVAC